jgi:hypothetical protein
MTSISAFLTAAFVLTASSSMTGSAVADSRVFIIANESDGYGIDQCLARGDRCGAHAALSYCKSRAFDQAAAYRRVDPDEVTGSVPMPAAGACVRGKCDEFIAITCSR